ncbi:hypothetical protein [Synechocystis sp. LKSZ1]|uniref:hypothetical protein n=1 Tax=Synechocystis sp. LKSZ1 TaxID=3144951 RepID=UPI00336BF3B8
MTKLAPTPLRSLNRPLRQLYHAQLTGRWLVVGIAWCTLAPWALWQFRENISLLWEYFTWAGVRYALMFQLGPALALFLCLGLTAAVLVRQSIHILWGLSPRETLRLRRRVQHIQAKGPKHPLWPWIFPKRGVHTRGTNREP